MIFRSKGEVLRGGLSFEGRPTCFSGGGGTDERALCPSGTWRFATTALTDDVAGGERRYGSERRPEFAP